jgi:hypothetical protein
MKFTIQTLFKKGKIMQIEIMIEIKTGLIESGKQQHFPS